MEEEKTYIAVFKNFNGYFSQVFSDYTINQLEKEKKRIMGKYEAEFVCSGEVKNLNQSLGIKILIEDVNNSQEDIDIKGRLEELLNREVKS